MTGNLKKALLPNLPYLLFVYLFDKLESGRVRQKNGLIYATNYFLADEIALWL